MMLTKKITGGLALAALGALGLSGCSGGASTDDDTLSLWMVTQEDDQGVVIRELISAFEEESGIAVELEERAVDDHKTALRQAAGTDIVPDIYWYWEGSGLGGELIDAGMSRELTDYYEEYGWDDRFTPASMAGITQYDGYHGVPWTQQGEGLYYNKQLFAEAGIDEAPQTYDDLVAAADALVDAGITPLEFGGTVNWDVMRLLDSLIELECGPETADALNTGDGDWGAEPCVTAAFTELKRWGDDYLPEGFMGISDLDGAQQFFSGQAAMSLEGTWYSAQIAANGMDPENIGVVPFPTGTGRLYGFGEGFYISSATEKDDQAAQFLDFITSEEGQAIAGATWTPISVNASVEPDTSNPLNAVWRDIYAAADGGYMNNDQNFDTATTGEYWRVQNSVLTGDIAPEDAGAEFQQFRDAN